MRLTESMRSAFVRAAMQDVPSNHKTYEAEAHKLLIQDSIDQLPKQLVSVAGDKNLSVYLNKRNHWFYKSPFSSVYVFTDSHGDFRPSATAQKKLDALTEKAQAESTKLQELREKLEATAKSCNTRKQLAELLPEFEKYLPADAPSAGRSVPAIANLVADFTKAGWPKGKAKA